MITKGDTTQNDKKKSNMRFGELLVSKGLLNNSDLSEALDEQRSRGGRLGEILIRLKMLSDDAVKCALAEHLSTEFVHLEISEIDMSAARLIPEVIAKRFSLVAIGQKDNRLTVAMADPLDVIATDTVTLKTGREIRSVLGSRQEIQNALQVIYHGSDVDEQSLRDLVELHVEDEVAEDDAVMEDAL